MNTSRLIPGLALAASLFATTAAWAGVGAPPSPLAPLPTELRAGETVALRWAALPAGAEEFEILLSLDDGRSWRVRVTPELDAGNTQYLWRVPDLPAARARLRVRMGTPRAEIACEPSEPFRIVGDATGAEDRSNEERFVEDPSPRPLHGIGATAAFAGGGPRVQIERGAVPVVAITPSAATLDAPRGRSMSTPCAPAPAPLTTLIPTGKTPPFVPLRN
jgi:hypothetical protein